MMIMMSVTYMDNINKNVIYAKFGRWNVISDIDNVKDKDTVLCECSCEEKTRRHVLVRSLKNGKSKSCGCFAREIRANNKRTHDLSRSKIYRSWANMINRCEYKDKNGMYERYGGRGIKVCDEWRKSFESFYEWAINNGYQEHLQIDRINNDGNYCPENCQWITLGENMAVGKRRSGNNASGYIGVCRDAKDGKWTSYITCNKERYTLGRFADINDAVEARIAKEIELFGEQRTNFHYNK